MISSKLSKVALIDIKMFKIGRFVLTISLNEKIDDRHNNVSKNGRMSDSVELGSVIKIELIIFGMMNFRKFLLRIRKFRKGIRSCGGYNTIEKNESLKFLIKEKVINSLSQFDRDKENISPCM